ncbi:MAG: ABC transporter transmembrane domain-containing protein [Alphaproteobacteria bacterium]
MTAQTDAPPTAPMRQNLRHLRMLFAYLRPYRLHMAGAFVALSVAAGTVLAFGAGLRWLVDDGFRSGNAALLDEALIGVFGIVALLSAATFSRAYLVAWIGERLAADLRRAVFDNVISLSPTFYEITPTGEVLSRLTADTTLLQTVVGASLSMALRNALMFVGATIMMAVTSPRLTALVFLIVPLVVIPLVVFGRRVRRLSRASQDRVGDVGAYVEESLNAASTVQAFGHEDLDRAHFRDRVEIAFTTAVRRVRARSALSAVVILMVFTSVGVILWVGGHDMLAGRITPGELSAFVFYAVVTAGSVGVMSEFFGDLQRAAGAGERLIELINTRTAIAAPARPAKLPLPARGAVRFDHVGFSYPSRRDRPVLDDFTLNIKAGGTVALVGPSGAGKTTVFHLLLRFYDPQSGRVSLDGVDLRRADPREIRARIGLVPQEPVTFSADAWENIAYGRPGASREEIRAAADAAHASDFLDRLPDGFASHLGQKGVRLSGGQRQRIAIARAVLRDPALLLLDEATSALDSESERLVQTALEDLMGGRTTLVIAHRLATVQKAGRIIVMDQGRIVGAGVHNELMSQGGLYARLAALQFDDAAGAGKKKGAAAS